MVRSATSSVGTTTAKGRNPLTPAAPDGRSPQPAQPGSARARLSKAWTTVKNWFSRCFEAAVSCGFCRNKVSPEEEGREAELSEDRGTGEANLDAAPKNAAVVDEAPAKTGADVPPEDEDTANTGAERSAEDQVTTTTSAGDSTEDEDTATTSTHDMTDDASGQEWPLEQVRASGTLVLGRTSDATRDDDADRDAAASLLRQAATGAPMDQVEVLGEISPSDTKTLNVLLALARAGAKVTDVEVKGTLTGIDAERLDLLLSLQAAQVRTVVEVEGTVDASDKPTIDQLLKLSESGVNLSKVSAHGKTSQLGDLEAIHRANMKLSAVSLSGEFDMLHLRRLRKLPPGSLNLQNVSVSGNEVRCDADFTPSDLLELAKAGLNLNGLKLGGTVDFGGIAGKQTTTMMTDLPALLKKGARVDPNMEVRGTLHARTDRLIAPVLLHLAEERVKLENVQALGTVSCVSQPGLLKRLGLLAEAGVNVRQVIVTGEVGRKDENLLAFLSYLKKKGVSVNTTWAP
jgi:hypothetical protein